MQAYYFGVRESVYPDSANRQIVEFDFYQGYCIERLPLEESYTSLFGCGHTAHFFVNVFGLAI